MLFGEYLVLQGAKTLAFPLRYGQKLYISPSDKLTWESESPDGQWFNAEFSEDFEIVGTTDEKVANVLRGLFQHIRTVQPDLKLKNQYKIVADFDLSWGLGSSSTLISLLSQWSGADPYELLDTYFGGSGYDVACAVAEKPIIYTVRERTLKEVDLPENITKQLLFVYLGQKQNSRDEIKRFEEREVTHQDVEAINKIVDASVIASDIEEFEALLNKSESILSPILGREKLKDSIFADYKYTIKSLGAWGGDFFLATFRDLDEAKNYFKNKGLSTMFTYSELIK